MKKRILLLVSILVISSINSMDIWHPAFANVRHTYWSNSNNSRVFDYYHYRRFDTDKKDHDGNNILHIAAQLGLYTLCFELEYVISDNWRKMLHEQNNKGEIPLHVVANRLTNFDLQLTNNIVRFFTSEHERSSYKVVHGLSVRDRDFPYCQIERTAKENFSKSTFNICRGFIRLNLDINAKNLDGLTPIDIAAKNKDNELVDLLLTANGYVMNNDPKCAESFNKSYLYLKRIFDYVLGCSSLPLPISQLIMSCLYQNDQLLSFADENCRIVFLACNENNLNLLNSMLKYNISQFMNSEGENLMFKAVKLGNIKLAKFFLDNNFGIETPALEYSMKMENASGADMTKFLLSQGGEIHLTSNDVPKLVDNIRIRRATNDHFSALLKILINETKFETPILAVLMSFFGINIYEMQKNIERDSCSCIVS